MVITPKKDFHYSDDDAVAFGYYKGKMYISQFGKIHPLIDIPELRDAPYKKNNTFKKDRTDFVLPGRVWIIGGILSFWVYPTIEELHKIIRDLDVAIKETLNYDSHLYKRLGMLKIEVIPDKDTMSKLTNDEKSLWYEYDGDTILVPISKYEGSGEWSPEVKNKPHTEIGKGGEAVPNGVGSRKPVSGYGDTPAERRFKMGSIAEAEDGKYEPIINLMVYHGTNAEFNRLNLKYSYQGILWFTDNINKIKNNEHGGQGHKIILSANLTLNNPAGWNEYEKYGLGEIRGLGYDGIKLDDDYIIFSTKSLKNVKKLKSDSINETPDIVQNNGEEVARFFNMGTKSVDKNAVAFGYHNDEFYMGKLGSPHGSINLYGLDTTNRSDFKYAGRVWFDKMIISFWDYPSVSILKQILSDLDKSMEEMYGMNYNLVGSEDKLMIEVIPLDKVRDKSNLGWKWDADNSILIPVSEYTGSIGWSPDIKVKKHIEIGKGGESVPDGIGSRKYSYEIGNSDMSPVEYNDLRNVSENKKYRMKDLL